MNRVKMARWAPTLGEGHNYVYWAVRLPVVMPIHRVRRPCREAAKEVVL